jgi:hypothetical protein
MSRSRETPCVSVRESDDRIPRHNPSKTAQKETLIQYKTTPTTQQGRLSR